MSIFFTPAPAPASTATTNAAAFNTVVTLTGSSTLSTQYATYFVSSATNVNLTLPAPNATYKFIIKKTAANTNTITLVRNGSESIDNIAANYTLSGSSTSELCAWTIVSDGSNFFII